MHTMLSAQNLAALAQPAVALSIGLFFLGGWYAKKVDYFIRFSIAYLAFALGISLQTIHLPISTEASILLTGLIYAVAILCFYHGLVLIGRGRSYWKIVAVITLLFLVSRYVYTIHEFSGMKRIYALQTFITLLCLLALWSIRRIALKGSGAERLMFFAVLLFTFSSLPRTYLTLQPERYSYGYSTSPYWISIQIIFNMFMVLLSLSILLVHTSRNLTRAERKASIDPLTQLSNRNGFNSRVEAIRAQQEFYALIFIDLDRFKWINDVHGHGVGDEVLARVSTLIARNVREHDQAARYGGEEFLLFLPNTTIDAAKAIAERLRQSFMQEEMNDIVEDLRFTASFGVAEFSARVPIDTAYRHVDKLMYRAKEKGRNRVYSAEEAVELS